VIRARRAPLFLPGDSERKIAKAAALGADAVVLDLEDGVAASQKAAARALTARALRDIDFGASERLVRVNAAGSGLEREDLAQTLPGRPNGYVLPKVESAETVRQVSAWLCAEERTRGWPEGGIGLLALIESAGGVLRLAEIAGADARLCALIFGAEDFAASIGAKRTAEGREVLYARSAVVVAAAAHGLAAVDTLFVDFQDDEGLRRDAAVAVEMGFSGKLAIHPRQVPILHAAFTPPADEVAAAQRLLDAFEAHARQGTGTFALDGKMVDMPMVRSARQVLARAGIRRPD
jgi:citrate lyase beta subunit